MVAEQHVNAAAGRLGLALEPPEKVERLARIGAAIDDVAELHEVRRAAGPAAVRVDHARDCEDLDITIVRAVNVADRDDVLDALPFAGTGRARDGRRQRKQKDSDDADPETKPLAVGRVHRVQRSLRVQRWDRTTGVRAGRPARTANTFSAER